ncbi:DUF6786 family protein [Aquirufa rosea]|uniref:Lipoprotein n=1 Tax=Aquirufa rosea TaxID=2509241 RepID=A0A4Q1BZJ3_9BACT|nr:DUF6786 family protein [Aquirufa rosea]RXK48957.1 hypothetical protein ESB04_08385 [Aquirufa rosea]
MKTYCLLILLGMMACQPSKPTQSMIQPENSFAYDYELLKNDPTTVLLSQGDQQVLVVGKYQARVMTSSSMGREGFSYGWINHELIQSGKLGPHMNAFGGEERFWLGPEGGQYSVYFKAGDPFTFEHWQTPAIIDTETYPLVKSDGQKALFHKDFEIENYSGTKFKLALDREIKLLSQEEAEKYLNVSLQGLSWVGYQTDNTLKNTGADWNKSTGVLSIWLLGMMKASEQNTILIPYQKGKEAAINDAYFGKIPADRLIKKDGMLYFKADANSRGKLGIPPQALVPLAASYDATNHILTILQFDYHGEKEYVNSMWEIQEKPYQGDALNAYNDGKNDTGTQMGKFYELESSSPAIALAQGQSLRHVQRTFHLEGMEAQLNQVCQQLLGIQLSDLPWK